MCFIYILYRIHQCNKVSVRTVTVTVVNCWTNTQETHGLGSSIGEDKFTVSTFWKEDERANKYSARTVLWGLLDLPEPYCLLVDVMQMFQLYT